MRVMIIIYLFTGYGALFGDLLDDTNLFRASVGIGMAVIGIIFLHLLHDELE